MLKVGPRLCELSPFFLQLQNTQKQQQRQHLIRWATFVFGVVVVDCKSYLPRLTFFPALSLSLIILGSVTYYTQVLCVVWQIYYSSSGYIQFAISLWYFGGGGGEEKETNPSLLQKALLYNSLTQSKQSFSWQFFPFPFLTNIPSQKWHSFYTIFFLIFCRHTLLFRLCVVLLLLFAFLPWKQQQRKKD